MTYKKGDYLITTVLDKMPHIRGLGRRPRGASPRPRSGAAAERSTPLPSSSGCEGTEGREELFHVQGQEGLL